MLSNDPEVVTFLMQSNFIENERSEQALTDVKKAWDYLIAKDKILLHDILEVHRLVMENLRPDIAGKWRGRDVWIGNERKRFVGEDVLEYQILNVCTLFFLSSALKGDKNAIAKDAHVMFEKVHPFEDGNGRVGRIIYNWHRLKMGLPLHIIYEGEEQLAYYKWFK